MKLRSKFTIAFAIFLVILVAAMLFFVNSYFGDLFKHYTLNNFRIAAELSESSYFSFVKAMEVRTIDWSSDGYIRRMTRAILEAPDAKRAPLVAELNRYLREEKIIYDPKVMIIDILDKDGIVISSSRADRIGTDEKSEELEHRAVRFTEAIKAGFGEAFVAPAVFEEDEDVEPMIHMTTHIFAPATTTTTTTTTTLPPLDAVLLLHFSNVEDLQNVLFGSYLKGGGRVSGEALTDFYKTADVYLVNKNRMMITPSRFNKETVLKQKVDTEPIGACLENGKEVNDEYVDYRGHQVYGASMCIQRDGLVLVVEIETQEVLAPFQDVSRFLFLIGAVILVLAIIMIVLLVHWLLGGLSIITSVAESVTQGKLGERAAIDSKDEIGYLAKTFNSMLDSIGISQKELREAELRLKEVNAGLEQRVQERTVELMALKVGLEKTVASRTAELQVKLDELEKFKKLTIGRELKMIELKREVDELKKSESSKTL